MPNKTGIVENKREREMELRYEYEKEKTEKSAEVALG